MMLVASHYSSRPPQRSRSKRTGSSTDRTRKRDCSKLRAVSDSPMDSWNAPWRAALLLLHDRPATGRPVLLPGPRTRSERTINGQRYNIGGCRPARRPLRVLVRARWPLSKDPDAFVYRNHSLSKPSKSFEWRARSGAPSVPWPPRDSVERVEFSACGPPKCGESSVHYEMYDNIPAYRKLVSVRNDGSDTVTVDSLVVELFRAELRTPQNHRPGKKMGQPRPERPASTSPFKTRSSANHHGSVRRSSLRPVLRRPVHESNCSTPSSRRWPALAGGHPTHSSNARRR